MKYAFANMFLDEKDLLSQQTFSTDKLLLENNDSQIKTINEFYKDEAKAILFVNGFMGSGKVEVVKYSTSFLNGDVITLKYNCFNSTILDDILLEFFKEFRKLASNGIIELPKIKTDNFAERINTYFSHIDKPFLIILDSFEEVLDKNRQEILDFLFHIMSLEKTKIILIGRSYDAKLFEGHDVARVTTKALERKIFDKLLQREKIKAGASIVDEFYQHTRGYYFYTILAIKIIQARKSDLSSFMERLKKMLLPFSVFLEKELLSTIPPEMNHLFWFLILIRHDVSIDFLKKMNLYNEQKVNEFIENKIIVKDGNKIYIQDYFDDITEAAPQSLIIRLRQYLVNMYQSQLPLKPFERDICISRQTMRAEIAYHQMFLPKTPMSYENANADINYLSYSKVYAQQSAQGSTQNKPNLYEKATMHQQNQNQSKFQPTSLAGIDTSKSRNVSLNLSELTSNLPQNTNQNTPKQAAPKLVEETPVAEEKKTLKQLVILIKKAESLYKYDDVLEFAQQALALKKEPKYQETLPFLYAKMAVAYSKTAQHDNALSYYRLLEQIFKDDGEKLCQIKMKIADIYYDTYKFDMAKGVYIGIVTSSYAKANGLMSAYLKLLNIAEEKNAPDAEIADYFTKAMKLTDNITQTTLLAEFYFKYALYNDDIDEVEKARQYYKKCVEIDNTSANKFLSSSYSNLAELALEDENKNDAITYYQNAFNADKASYNNEGAYDTATRLALLYKNVNNDKAVEYYKTALEYAQNSNDEFYIISASLNLGDFYYEIRRNEQSLKYYLYANNFASKTSKENSDKIKARLHDIKLRLGEANYNNLVNTMGNNG